MEQKKKRTAVVIWIVIFALAFFIYREVKSRQGSTHHVEYSTFLEDLESGRVTEVLVDGNLLTVTVFNPNQTYTTFGATGEEFMAKVSEFGVRVGYGDGSSGASSSLWMWLPLVIVLALIILFFVSLKKQQGAAGNVFTLGKSRARRITENDIHFSDVGGLAEAKEDFGDLIDFLKNSQRWISSGVRLQRGVLLVGPPGCGKTLLARAVAGEASVPFFTLSASEFVELFVGVGAARVRDMFDQAKKESPAIIFIDELDAVGRRRGSGVGSAHDEREQTLNQLLVAMDGFETTDEIVVIAATNRPDVLDKALLRPGRFDLRIEVGAPDQATRLEILKIHTQKKPLTSDVKLDALAEKTVGFTGADLETLANQAALYAVRAVRLEGAAEPQVTQAHFDRAFEKLAKSDCLFNKLDTALIESASQLSQPTGNVVLRVTLRGGEKVEGRLVWADAAFIKIREADADEPAILPKLQVLRIESLPGTDAETNPQSVGDQWAHGVAELA